MGDREWGMGNGERTKNNKIQFPPLTRGGLGWGETIVDTLIIPFKTSSQHFLINFFSENISFNYYYLLKNL